MHYTAVDRDAALLGAAEDRLRGARAAAQRGMRLEVAPARGVPGRGGVIG